MAMVNVGHSSLQAGLALQPKSVGLVWRSAAAWFSPCRTCGSSDSDEPHVLRPWIGFPCYGAIEIVEVIIIIISRYYYFYKIRYLDINYWYIKVIFLSTVDAEAAPGQKLVCDAWGENCIHCLYSVGLTWLWTDIIKKNTA